MPRPIFPDEDVRAGRHREPSPSHCDWEKDLIWWKRSVKWAQIWKAVCGGGGCCKRGAFSRVASCVVGAVGTSVWSPGLKRRSTGRKVRECGFSHTHNLKAEQRALNHPWLSILRIATPTEAAFRLVPLLGFRFHVTSRKRWSNQANRIYSGDCLVTTGYQLCFTQMTQTPNKIDWSFKYIPRTLSASTICNLGLRTSLKKKKRNTHYFLSAVNILK